MNLAFPYRFDSRGRTDEAGDARYIRGLIEQVLFTSPGERVMRPDFGSGLAQLVFAPNSPELAATTQVLVQSALQQWLGRLITVEEVQVTAEENALSVKITYLVNRTQARETADFTGPGGGGAP